MLALGPGKSFSAYAPAGDTQVSIKKFRIHPDPPWRRSVLSECSCFAFKIEGGNVGLIGGNLGEKYHAPLSLTLKPPSSTDTFIARNFGTYNVD